MTKANLCNEEFIWASDFRVKKKPPWWATMATGRHRGWNKNLRELILNSKHVAGGEGGEPEA